MKYGVVYYKDTDNIGDDIQNYAAIQFLPQVDYFIDREALSEFCSEEPVAVILNGWFLHNKFNWPPAKCIYPLCTSIHFSKNDYMGIGYQYLDGIGKEYLKAYEPIGCRDQNTLDLLQQRGVQAFLSGCITLTLNHRKRTENAGKYICLVDVPKEVDEKVSECLSGRELNICRQTHWTDYKKDKKSWTQRMDTAEKLLDLYQNAHCVITKRLHCALPCLALGTPVLLILDKEKDDTARYSHFIDLLHTCSANDFINQNSAFDILNPPENKILYQKERDCLIKSIKRFVDETKSEVYVKGFNLWNQKEESQIIQWRMELMSNAAAYAAGRVDVLLRELGQLKQDKFQEIQTLSIQYENDTDKLKKYIQTLKKEEDRLNAVIIEKHQEELRLNTVISKKDTDETRLNQLLSDQDQILKNVQEYISDKEYSSAVWTLFFSKKFRQSPVFEKIKQLIRCIRRHSHTKNIYLEDYFK